MTDIWNKKPEVYTQKWGVDHGYYKKEEMDVWLERLKAYYDVTTNSKQVYEWKAKADILERIEEMGVVTVYDDRHWSTDYNELKENAEKWNQWSMGHYRMTTRERLRELIQTEKRLQAVRTTRNNLYEALPVGGFDAFDLIKVIKTHITELDGVLDGSELQQKGDNNE